jgi:TP901 family phage tail tape measure protein
MAFNAGEVITILRGKFEGAAFAENDAAIKKAVATAEAGEARMAASQGRLTKSQDALTASAGRSVAANENLAKSHARLRESVPLAAMGQLEKSSQRAEQNLNKLGKGAAIGAGAGLATLAAATIYAAKTAGDFEKQMRNVNSIAKLSEAGYHKLSQGVLSLAGETAQAPKVLAEGLYQLVSSGFNASDSLVILQSSAKAATAGLTDTATATTAVAAVLNAYRLPASQASKVSDVLFETVNRGVLTFEELSKSIGDVLPFSSALGISLPEVGAAVSTLTKEGINAPETMTRLRRVMQSFLKPGKDMKEAIKQAGAASGESLVHHKGLQGALEAVIKTTDGTKTSIGKLFPDIRAFGGALALTGKNARSAQQDLKAFQDTGGATKKVFEEQAKGAEFAGKKLSSSFQAAAVIVGNQVLPHLADAAGQFTQILQHAASDGSLERFGQSAIHIFGTIGSVIGNVAPMLYDVARALVQVGGALGLGNSAELTGLIVAFVAFKGLAFVAPILSAIAAGIAEIGVAAATAGSLAAFGGDLVALAGGPVSAVVIALSLAAGAFAAIKSGLFSSASAAERNAAAMQKDKDAINALHEATSNAANAQIASQRAALSHKEALENLKKTEKEVHDGTLKGTDAQNALANAHLRVKETASANADAKSKATATLDKETHAAEKATAATSARHGKTLQEIADIEHRLATEGKASSGERRAALLAKLTALQARYNREARDQAQANAEVAVSEESRMRIEAGRSAITAKNAQGVAKLQNALFEAGVPKKVVTRYELDDQGAQAKLGQLAAKLNSLGQQQVVAKVLTTAPSASVAIEAFRAILAGVPSSKVIHILHNAPSAKAAMSALSGAIHAVPGSKSVTIATTAPAARGAVAELQAAINGLQGRTITITTIARQVQQSVGHAFRAPGRAAGRPRGSAEASFVGEGSAPEYVIDRATGAGVVVQGPTLMGLSPDDYVVPLERRFRGRALGLFAQLARDLEIPGFKAGRKPSKGKRHYAVPDAIPPLSLPLSDIEAKQSKAKEASGKAATKVKELTQKVHDARSPKSKDHHRLGRLTKDLAVARRDAAKDKRELAEWTRTLREARAFDGQIKRTELQVENARGRMKLAASHDDPAGYEKARGERLTALGHLQALIKQAQKQVKTGTEYALQLEAKVLTAEEETLGTRGEPFEPARSKEAEEEERTGMTAAEQAEEKRIEKDIALAALTPGTADDQAKTAELVSLLERVLGEVIAEPGPRGGDDSIRAIAESLKTAQSNLASFSGVGTNENPDVQAQLTQRDERLAVEKRRADIAEGALAVFSGSGDIGAGGSNAQAAVIQNNYMLHPADPSVLKTIGEAATKGISYQGSRDASRIRVGP